MQPFRYCDCQNNSCTAVIRTFMMERAPPAGVYSNDNDKEVLVSLGERFFLSPPMPHPSLTSFFRPSLEKNQIRSNIVVLYSLCLFIRHQVYKHIIILYICLYMCGWTVQIIYISVRQKTKGHIFNLPHLVLLMPPLFKHVYACQQYIHI